MHIEAGASEKKFLGCGQGLTISVTVHYNFDCCFTVAVRMVLQAAKAMSDSAQDEAGLSILPKQYGNGMHHYSKYKRRESDEVYGVPTAWILEWSHRFGVY